MKFSYNSSYNFLIIFFYLVTFANTSYSDNSYQTEFSVSSFKIKDSDSFFSSDFDSTSLSATVYLEDVNTNSHPYQEAGFLEQKSSLTINYTSIEFNSGGMSLNTTEENNFVIFGTYIDAGSKFIYEGAYGIIDGDTSSPFSTTFTTTIDGNVFGLGFGKYLTDDSSLLISYLKFDSDTTESDPIIPFTFTFSTEIETTGIEYKLVKKLENNSAYNIEASYSKIDISDTSPMTSSASLKTIELIADYYINQKLSVGGLASTTSGDNIVEGKTLGIRFSIFITPNFSLFGKFSKFTADDDIFSFTNNDTEETTIGALARF